MHIAELALEFRQQFKRDVVIDMVCYRKWGHNEGGRAAFTQPVEYKKIERRQSVSAVYTEAARRRDGSDLRRMRRRRSIAEFRADGSHDCAAAEVKASRAAKQRA